MSGNEAASFLSSLFDHAHLEIQVPRRSSDEPAQNTNTTHSPCRTIAFYDEILSFTLHLQLPPTAALPRPQVGYASYPLPIQIDDDDYTTAASDDPTHWSERTEQARATRLALSILLSNLHIQLKAAYTSPRPALVPGSNPIPPTSANTSLHTSSSQVPSSQRPTPSTHRRDAAYADPSLPGDEVVFHNIAWLGNRTPPDPLHKGHAPGSRTDVKRSTTTISRATSVESEGADHAPLATSFATWDQKEERWRVEWEVKVPIVYARHRSPHPVLLLTSLLSLRLSPASSSLSVLSSSLSGLSYLSTRPGFSSWADHDLLTTLSSGPVYPDESPSQRAARAASALAKLPLSRLPSKVLGTRLVTPERSARDVGIKLLASAAPLPSMTDDEDDENDGSQGEADVGGGSSWYSGSGSGSSTRSSSSSSSSTTSSSTKASSLARSRDLSEEGLIHRGPALGIVTSANGSDVKEGDTTTTSSRSVLCALDIRSAIGVRMRTTIVPSLDVRAILRGTTGQSTETSGRPDYDDDEELSSSSSAGRALVLCVEVDNPSDSGLLFQVESCNLDIAASEAGHPGSVGRLEKSSYQATATLLTAGGEADRASQTAFRLAQGEQRNLLYVVQFTLTPEGRSASNAMMGSNVWGSGPTRSSLNSPWPWSASRPSSEPNKNVAIVVRGRPLLLTGRGHDPVSVTPDFASTWNCQLDMTSLQEDLRRRIAAEQPSDEVLASAIPATPTGSATSGGGGTIGGSARHTASALAMALRQDEFTARTSASMMASPPIRSGVERSVSSRFLPTPSSATFGRLSPIGLGTPKSSPVSGMSGPLVAEGASGSGRDKEPIDATMASPAIRSGGIGLLAQARMRAASIRIEDDHEYGASASIYGWDGRVNAPGGTSREVLRRVTPHRKTGISASPLPLRVSTDTGGNWVPLRRLVTPDGPRARVRSAAFTSDTAGPAMTGSQGGVTSDTLTVASTYDRGVLSGGSGSTDVLLPFKFDKDLSWQKRDGLLVNTRIRSSEGAQWFDQIVRLVNGTVNEGQEWTTEISDTDAEADVECATSVVRKEQEDGAERSRLPFAFEKMSSFYLEVLLTNRADTTKTFVLSWMLVEETPSTNVGGGALPGSEAIEGRERLMDAETARRRYDAFFCRIKSSAVVPLENYIFVGPILPGASEMALLPMMALMSGRHALGDLLISDQVTGQERILRGVGRVVVAD